MPLSTGRRDQRASWRAASLAGLLTSTFSTLVINLVAPRIGRNVALSWMEVSPILLRDRGIRVRPTAREFLTGVLIHQFADFVWALTFFGLGARWSQRFRPATLLALAPPWAVLTSAIEYWLILPWLSPLLRMQAPYWIGLGAHVASGAAYPLFPLLRKAASGPVEKDSLAASSRYAKGLGALVGLTGLWAFVGESGYEPPWPFGTREAREANRRYLHHMIPHHQVGIRLLKLAVEKAVRDEFRTLNTLMLAEHIAETEIMGRWWRSWYGEEMPQLTPEEYAHMPGMPDPAVVEELERLEGLTFETRYLPVMVFHHEGGIKMSDEAWGRAADPRVRLMADQIRHAQRGQIERMHLLERTAIAAPPAT